jgi:hypothetical protein
MMKRILCTIVGAASLFLGVAGSAQQEMTKGSNGRIKDNQLSADASSSPLDLMRGKKEDLTKRDAYSKHFLNEDGSYTAVIGAGPIHYEKNGQFLDIDHTITAQPSATYPYANTTNMMESYFGATSHTGIKSVTAEGEVREFLNNKMYWEVNGQAVNTVQGANVPVSLTQNDKALYDNLFGQIGAEFTIESGKRKLNYIIPSAQALTNIPIGSTYLVFSEEVIIPNGWSYHVDERLGVVLTDDTGRRIYSFESPVSTDASDALHNDNTVMEVIQDGNVLTVLTKVKVSWLLASNIEFPVLVDPTVNVYPNNTTNWTGYVWGDGEYVNSAINTGRVSSTWIAGSIRFNLSSITVGSTISNATGFINILAGYGTNVASRTWALSNSSDPIGVPTGITAQGLALFNSMNTAHSATTTVTSLGWRSSLFSAGGRTYLMNGLANGFVAMGLYAMGTWNNGQYFETAGYSSSNRPYLNITYTEPATPPSCATIVSPADGITNAASGNQLTWNAASGATSYDVYFGTSATPALVGNVTVTNYNPGCLEPNTTYYWKVVPKNANGDATGCSTWSFTTTGQLAIYAQNWDGISTPGMFSEITAQDGWLASSTADQSGLGDRNVWAAHTYAGRSISGNSIGVSAYLLNAPVSTGELAYYDDLATDRWVYRNVSTAGLKDVTVSFRYKAGGEAGADYGSVMYNPTGANPQNINNWLEDSSQGGNNDDNRFYNQANPTYETILLPADADNNANLRIGFRWTSNANEISSYPSFVVDDIIVTGCPTGGSISPLVSTFNSGNSVTLTLSGVFSCAKLQWEQSASASGPWSDISGATTNVLNTGTVSTTTYYRCKVYYGTCEPSYQTQVASVEILSPAVVSFHDYGGTSQLTFNNSRSNATNQTFRLSHSLVTASAYQVEVNTAADFSGTAYTQNFTGSYAANTQTNFTFTQIGGSLVNGSTYYVRARALESGSLYGAWTTGTYSFTYDTAKEEADWFQTTQAQFQTGALDGVEANAANNVVKLSGNNNAIVNGTFANTSGWTTFKTNGTPALIEVSSTDCSNCPAGTNRNLKMYLWTAGVLSGDIMIVSQQVDLTNVNEITYNANSYYGPNSSNPGGTISNLRFMIGGASNNEVGDVLHTTNQAYCTSYCTNSVDDPNVVINTSGYTGVHTIKFVVKFTQTHTTAGLLAFYVNNVSATMASNASITSPTIYKASKQNTSNWETLSWNQTLNGGNITLALQEVVGGTWTAISGFDNITAGGNGLQTMDVATLTADSLRIVATLSGTTSPALHDWAISAGGCVAPAVIGELEATIIGCYYNITSLSLSGEGTAPLAYQWQVSTNGGATWNNLSNDFYYGGVKTTQLNIANVPNAFNGNKYRLRITNACGTAYSNETLMNVQECPPNDNPSNSNPNLSNNTYVYPNNVQVSGSTTNATVNPATGTRDVWYRIIPISNGVTIKVSSTVIDPVLYLFDSNDMITPIDVENLIAGTGTEIMNVTGLTEGHVYRLAVASASELDGEFKLVVQHLRKPQCSVNTNISLCEMLSTSITGANSVTYEFTDVNSNVTTSYTAPGYNMLASTAAAQLRYGATYNAQYTANYHLQNGLGEAETILVPNTQTCNINIGSHREVVVKVNNRCTSGAVHARSGYLTGEFVGAGGVCTITGYEYEYTPVANCAGDDPQPLDKFSKVIISASAYMSLNYAFNHMPLANNPNRGYWSVRIRPRFNGYSGVYGQPFVIAVNGTAPVVGMAAEPSLEPASGVNTLGGNIDANIYPNPNNGELVNLNITGITSTEVYVRVMDSMGREVYTNRYSVDGTLNTMVSFTRPLAQGVYMVEMRAGEEVKTQRMVVTK